MKITHIVTDKHIEFELHFPRFITQTSTKDARAELLRYLEPIKKDYILHLADSQEFTLENIHIDIIQKITIPYTIKSKNQKYMECLEVFLFDS